MGSTLAKLAVREADGLHRFVLLPSEEIERAAREVEAIAPRHLGLTGAGASRLAQLLGLDTTPLAEFDAWRAGTAALLSRQDEPPSTREIPSMTDSASLRSGRVDARTMTGIIASSMDYDTYR